MPASFFNRFNESRQRGLIYPSPFFDIAQTYMPPTVKELFKWCKYYFYTHPIINPVVHKMAEYPITELIYHEVKRNDDDDPEDEKEEPEESARDAYEKFLEEILDIRSFLINCGLDYFTCGNSFVSMSWPFIRFLKCACGHQVDIASLKRKEWEMRNFDFFMKCAKCGGNGKCEVTDKPCKDHDKVAMIRWDPENITVVYTETNGRSRYRYTMPDKVKRDVRLGNQDAVEMMPMEFIQAAKDNTDLEFNKSNFFHMKRYTLAEQDQGWGKPLIMPAMRDAFYLQILRKANEAIAFQYIVPLTVLFPTPHGSFDPYRHIGLNKWKDRIEQEIQAWRDDPNYIPIMPFPIGNEAIFGQAKALMVTPEIRAISEQMVVGMGVPTEFVFGGLSYSGSSVSLRIVENHLLRYRESMLRMLKFIVERLRSYFNLPKIKVVFRDFAMADDIQKQQLTANFIANRQVSVRTGLEQLGLSYKNEEDKIRKEAGFMNEVQKEAMLAQAEAQGEANLKMSRYQVQAQLEMQLEQLKQQNMLLQNNPQAAQMLMGMQAQPTAGQGAPQQPQGGRPPQGAGAQTEGYSQYGTSPESQTAGDNIPPEGAPQQTQQHEAQGGYGIGPTQDAAMDPRLIAMSIAAQIAAIQDPAKRLGYEAAMKSTMPQLSWLVQEAQKRRETLKLEPPMPEQLPPRRKGGSPL